MKNFSVVLIGIVALTVIAGVNAAGAASVTIRVPVEAYDTGNADAVFPAEPHPDPNAQFTEIWGHVELLSYLAFDLNTLPEGFEIVGATVSVFDWEPDFEDEVQIALLDVPTDWDRTTLTYDLAIAQYGAAVASDDVGPIAAFDPAKLLWLGSAVMDYDNLKPPGSATVGSRRKMESVEPFTEADLVTALQEKRANGDGLVTLAIRGTTRDNNKILGIDFGDSEKGPTLELILGLPGGTGTTTTYDFDDMTLQGWTQVYGSAASGGPTQLGLISEGDPNVGDSVPPLPLSSPSFIGPVPFEADSGDNTRDRAHESLLIRSPEFRIYPNGQISFALMGGSHPNFDMNDVNANGLPAMSSGDGAIGVALRRVSDDQYISFYSRLESGSQFWETITLGEEELSDLVSGDEMYTLDFIDYHDGGWGWGGLDSVVIVEGTPVAEYNFDDGTLQGWTRVYTSAEAGGPTELGLISEDDPNVGDSVPPLPLSSPSFIGPVPFEADSGDNTRDRAHESLLIRSPEFRIYPNGQISFALMGGSHPNFDMNDVNANGLPAMSSGDGAIGVALRRVSDDQYISFYSRLESGSQFWETITLGEEELSDLVSGDEMYTLDFIDYHDGGWGWGGLDSVVIVEGTPVTTYDFDDLTRQGWTQVYGSTTPDGPTELGLISQDDPNVGNSVPPLPLSPPAFIGPVPFEAESGDNTRDKAHESLLIRSPEFRIYPNGQISFALIGGSHPNFDLDDINANGLPAMSSGDGAIGVALRRVSDDTYLAFYARSESGSQFWETLTLGPDELSNLVSGDESYTLDFIDYHNGGWGWGAIDSVVIVEGTAPPTSMLGTGFDFIAD